MSTVCLYGLLLHIFLIYAVADPECARGGGVSHIFAEKRGVSFSLLQKMHENAIFSTKRGGGAYAGYALCWIRL